MRKHCGWCKLYSRTMINKNCATDGSRLFFTGSSILAQSQRQKFLEGRGAGRENLFPKRFPFPPCKQTADAPCLYFEEAQPQRVADHGEGRQSHGGAGDHGREHGPAEDMQQPGGHGQAQQVVAEGPAQVLADVAHGGAGKGQSGDHI